MLFLGMLAFLQVTVIPGAVILKATKTYVTFLQWAIYSFALSLIANYCLVFILTAINLYNQLSMLIILAIEIIGLVWLYKQELQIPVFEIVEHQLDNLKKTINSLFLPNKENDLNNSSLNLLSTVLTLALLTVLIGGIVWTARFFISNLGTVFSTWDAVVSWNRWALSWTSGQIPLDTVSYPQLIPVNWSTTYIFIGNTIIQTFAKGIMPLFAIFMLLLFLDLGLKTKTFGFYAGGFFAQSLLKKFLTAEITSGYVDVAVAFFGFLAIYSLIKANNEDNSAQRNRHLLFGAVFAAGAGVTKQPGMYIFVLYPLLVYISRVGKKIPLLQDFKKHLIAFGLVASIPLSWYLFKQIHHFLNIDTYNFQEYLDVTANTYANTSLIAQIIAAIARFEGYLLLFALIIVGFPLLNSFYRALTILIILPYPLIWAWLAGYDMRNLAIFMPIFALTAGITLQEIYLFITKYINKTFFIKFKVYFVLVIVLLALIAMELAIPSETLLQQQTRLQKQIFSPNKNEMIYEVIEKNGPETKILTNYPVRFLPGLENNQIQFGFKNFDTFIMWVEDPDTQYLLFPNRASDQIKDYIEEKIANGDYELIFSDTEWVKYTMVHIINR